MGKEKFSDFFDHLFSSMARCKETAKRSAAPAKHKPVAFNAKASKRPAELSDSDEDSAPVAPAVRNKPSPPSARASAQVMESGALNAIVVAYGESDSDSVSDSSDSWANEQLSPSDDAEAVSASDSGSDVATESSANSESSGSYSCHSDPDASSSSSDVDSD